MYYVVWILGIMLAVMFSAIVTISAEKTGTFDEE